MDSSFVYLDGEKFFYKISSGLNEIIKFEKHLNEINLFPVADGDTGTNLALTSVAILSNTTISKSVSDVVQSMADAAFDGAKGNSGIIFAQFFRGLSESLKNKNKINIDDYTMAVKNAVDFTYSALRNPVEGTILSVMKKWSEHLLKIRKEVKNFKQLFHESFNVAQTALKDTINQIKVLKENKVVDAGAKGFVYFLEGIKEFLKSGKKVDLNNFKNYKMNHFSFHSDIHENEKYRYCTQFVIDNGFITKDTIIDKIDSYGDSLIVAKGTNKYKVHMHTNEPEKVVQTLVDQKLKIKNPDVDDIFQQVRTREKDKGSIALVTDSTCDIPAEIMDNYNIFVVPLNINFKDNEFLDKYTIKPDNLYSLIEKSNEMPKTSQPNVKTFIKFYKFLDDYYDEIISIHLSDKLSGTYNSASVAADTVNKDKIKVIDSKNLSIALGLVVLKTAREIEKKGNISIQKIEEFITNSKIFVGVKNLKYMIRGGRVSKVKGFFAKLLNLKPIVSIDEKGSSELFGKSFSYRGNLKRIKSIVDKKRKKSETISFAVGHVNAKNTAEEITNEIEKQTGIACEYIMDVSPIIGSHAGPGSIGVSILTE
ncbi:MAG TPA: DegV family protein [Candidatus Mcinerneyibacterium sp.]|nr:DegV family protein [Candidatus Mcinerneyibacterium sp.]